MCGIQPTIKSNDAAKGSHGGAANGQEGVMFVECETGEVW